MEAAAFCFRFILFFLLVIGGVLAWGSVWCPKKWWKREGKEMSLLLFRTVMLAWDVKAFFSCTCSVAEQLGVLVGC